MKKICVTTGSRAEYGLLRPLMNLIRDESEFELQIVATCMHLSPEFGLTYKEIEKDGFSINEKVEILLSSDSLVGTTKSMGLALMGLGEAYDRLRSDMIILLGDRFEIFCAAAAATICRIPIGHIHGGELTEGAFDDMFRHSITKMSYLHFTSTENYRKRVIQMGESPDRVFNVGALGLDNIRKLQLLTKGELEKQLGFRFRRKNLLVTFHPVTAGGSDSIAQFKILLGTLEDEEEVFLIFTHANADPGGWEINKITDEYVEKHPDNTIVYESLGQLKYLSIMQFVDMIIGNSSSGIIEMPFFAKPTINIGDRQKGRIFSESILQCEPTKEAISSSINIAFSKEFKNKCKSLPTIYGDGKAAIKIKEILMKIDLQSSVIKNFYNY